MITGSSDGIGRVIALQLAKYGFNLVLVSRSENKLSNVRDECLKLNPKIDVELVSLDFSQASIDDYKKPF
jgi:17beta-estradiol 17-dehydrogenase / very-long-chain 3-oxoacyl-CoA reductase